MMGARHAPGPWGLDYSFGKLVVVKGPQRFPICQTNTAPWGQANERREEANARLISSAPDYDAAARKMVAALGLAPDEVIEGAFGADVLEALTALRAAIAKATGEGES